MTRIALNNPGEAFIGDMCFVKLLNLIIILSCNFLTSKFYISSQRLLGSARPEVTIHKKLM